MKNFRIPASICATVAVIATAIAYDAAFAQQQWPDPVTRSGDTARFQDLRAAGRDPRVILVPSPSADTEICSYPSPGGNCYRFSNNETGASGAMVILLHTPALFRNSGIEQFSDPSRSTYAAACEASESWTSWTAIGAIPNTVGATYTEERFCSPGAASDSVPVCACKNSRETRTATVSSSMLCTYGNWTPDPSTVPDGQSFTQTGTLISGGPHCATTDTRPETGTQVAACNYGGAWRPAASTIPDGQSFTQSQNLISGPPSCADPRTRTSTGTQPASCVYDGNWQPATSSVPFGQSFTQTEQLTSGPNTCLATNSRPATGTQPLSCSPTWSPPASNYCNTNNSISQSRSVWSGSSCRTEYRTVSGTSTSSPPCGSAPPPPPCSWSGVWTPATSSVAWGQTFTQTQSVVSGGPSCSPRTQTATGTQPLSCSPTWSPSASGYCTTASVSQARTVWNSSSGSCQVENRTVSGTSTASPPCAPSCTWSGVWTPAASTIAWGQTFTQTQSVVSGGSSCSPLTQSATGTRPLGCSPSWSPSTSAYCTTSTVNQSRTVWSSVSGSCQVENRSVPGTATASPPCPAPPTDPCTYTAWSPPTYTALAGTYLTQTRSAITGTNCSPLSQRVPGTGVIRRVYHWYGAGTVDMSFCTGQGNIYAGQQCYTEGAAAYVERGRGSCQALSCSLTSETIGPP